MHGSYGLIANSDGRSVMNKGLTCYSWAKCYANMSKHTNFKQIFQCIFMDVTVVAGDTCRDQSVFEFSSVLLLYALISP